MFYFDPMYFLFISPALLLAMWAQFRVRSAYAEAQQVPAPMTGADAARRVLDAGGVYDVQIEPVPGELTDHYDPSARVLRLSSGVYGTRSMAAVGIAAHEAGHALQHAKHYAPLVVRNLAVPAASFGSGMGLLILFVGALMHAPVLIWAGILLFGCVVFFQVVNLPVEFDASARAKDELVSLGLINPDGLVYVRRVLNAAAWTYVAATLQSVLILLYYIMRFSNNERD
ncbi:MAG TPA: zinc metallopeptidase [Pirellulales bacterium]|nr:zinc metallopeptidase [Pirellulales bacterium]